jgi:uncharacterized membrane protein YgdD (TMEM256/DUF423 family)
VTASADVAYFSRALRAIAALLAALAVAAAAYASHGLSGDAQARLSLAAAFAFGHGVALLALAGFAARRVFRVLLVAMLIGLALFAGSLAGAALWGTSTALAPFGGSVLILVWLGLAFAFLFSAAE